MIMRRETWLETIDWKAVSIAVSIISMIICPSIIIDRIHVLKETLISLECRMLNQHKCNYKFYEFSKTESVVIRHLL